MNKERKYRMDTTYKELQESFGTLDPERDIQDLAASAAEIIASKSLSTNWNDILPMLDNQEISEQLRLAANIIFRAKLVLEEMQETPSVNNVVHNTMLMMDLLELANIKGYIPAISSVNFNKLKKATSSIELAVKKERVIDTIRELAKKNPDKGITWLRRKASKLLSLEGKRGYSYRQIVRDTEGIKIKS